jgi:hypothetical protein
LASVLLHKRWSTFDWSLPIGEFFSLNFNPKGILLELLFWLYGGRRVLVFEILSITVNKLFAKILRKMFVLEILIPACKH